MWFAFLFNFKLPMSYALIFNLGYFLKCGIAFNTKSTFVTISGIMWKRWHSFTGSSYIESKDNATF